MKKQIVANKPLRFDLYKLALFRIANCQRVEGEIVRFPKVFLALCRGFSIKKKDAWELLYLLRDWELIKIIAGHGVRLESEE